MQDERAAMHTAEGGQTELASANLGAHYISRATQIKCHASRSSSLNGALNRSIICLSRRYPAPLWSVSAQLVDTPQRHL